MTIYMSEQKHEKLPGMQITSFVYLLGHHIKHLNK